MKKVNKIIKEELFSLLKEVYTGTGSIDLTPANQGQVQALKNAIFDLIDDRDKLKKRVEKLESLVLGKLETDPQMQRLLPPEETKTMAIRRKVAEGKSTMKITKEQLTQIIKEEIANVLNERHADDWTDHASPSYPGAEHPPTMPSSYLEPTSKEDLCGGWKNMYNNPEALPADRSFALNKAQKNGCEWANSINEQ